MIEISIIITTINRPHHVKELLLSLTKQDFNKGFQIILIDQNSDDKTEKAFHEILNEDLCNKKDIQRTYIRNTNLTGLTQARNLGISLSKGSILLLKL